MLKNLQVFFMLLCLVFGACSFPAKSDPEIIFSSYKPILMDQSRVTSDLFFLPPKDKNNVTKLLTMDNYLLALEYGLGLHLYDVSDKDHPIGIGFYQIPACIDFEVKDRTVYANNLNDLILVDFTNVSGPAVIKRQVNIFDIMIKAPDGLIVREALRKLPEGTVVISYEKL
jgi:hypothetical protein